MLVKYVVSKSIVSYRTGMHRTYIVVVGHNDMTTLLFLHVQCA